MKTTETNYDNLAFLTVTFSDGFTVTVYDDMTTVIVGSRQWNGYHYDTVKAVRPATDEEEEAFQDDAGKACRQVEAEEAHGSTKSLPKGFNIGSDGRTYDQFDEPIN